jgi:hypothetical protein
MTEQNLDKTAIELFGDGVFPVEWSLIPLSGKRPRMDNWPEKELKGEGLLANYWSDGRHNGLGVKTGANSKGLLAIDIDGNEANNRFKKALGKAYEAPGSESTISWTSGKAGRRQIMYKVPLGLVGQLENLTKLSLDPATGEWLSTVNKGGEGQEQHDYQEVTLRFNGCQSVLPGSVHPDTKRRYKFLNYNEGKVATAPAWLIEALLGHMAPMHWVSQKEYTESHYTTSLPPSQIRGWFFREEVQKALMPRLTDLIFNHEVHQRYGWQEKDTKIPHIVSGCPWHGGESGTAFQVNTDTGCWYCHGCQVGGDVLDYKHKVTTDNKDAGRPDGHDLEKYVADIARGLGYDFPECANVKIQREAPLLELTAEQFFARCEQILDENDNREAAHFLLMSLVRDCGRSWQYRNGTAVEASYNRYKRQTVEAEGVGPNWAKEAQASRKFLIPGLLTAPNSIMLHARGGLGKTKVAVSLAKVLGTGGTMIVRGSKVVPTETGNVLFIGSDMSLPDYADYFEAQGIDPDTSSWLKFEPKWQQDEVRKMVRWIRKHNPVMVIIDSLTSVSSEIEAKENEKEYANSVYELARMNGTEFPATVFIWIHHNTKGGETFRGTDALRNAVSETWELKELPPEDQGNYGPLAKMLVVDKSRAGRQGDRMLIDTDVDENVEVRDLTPEESRYQGTGTLVPKTLVLGALRTAEDGLTCQEIHEALAERLVGEGTKVPARKTVNRWVENWASQGLILDLGEKRETEVRGKPATVWIHSQHQENPEREKNTLFNVPKYPNPLQENGSNSGHIRDIDPECPEYRAANVPNTDETHETPKLDQGIRDISEENGTPEAECPEYVPNDFAAPQGVSPEIGIRDMEFPSPKEGWAGGDPLAGLPLIPMDEFLETYETDTEDDK